MRSIQDSLCPASSQARLPQFHPYPLDGSDSIPATQYQRPLPRRRHEDPERSNDRLPTTPGKSRHAHPRGTNLPQCTQVIQPSPHGKIEEPESIGNRRDSTGRTRSRRRVFWVCQLSETKQTQIQSDNAALRKINAALLFVFHIDPFGFMPEAD